MKDWCILWKRISAESGQHIRAFVTFWAIARLPPFAMDKIESRGKNMLWYAFFDRKEEILYDEHEENIADRLVKVWRDSRCKELGCGSDGYGPDAVITSPEVYIKACADVSSTWSRKLETLYWDASTSLPEQVVVNIRQTQEKSDYHPGLQNLWIDYHEDILGDGPCERWTFLRSKASFKLPIEKLGSTTLRNLKLFALATPFWPGLRNQIDWITVKHTHKNVPPYRSLESFEQDSGPERFLNILRSIQPRIFYTLSIAPFQCKELLPFWAQIRFIHVFEMVTVTNDLEVKDRKLPDENVFFQKSLSSKTRLAEAEDVPKRLVEDRLDPNSYIRMTSRFIRSAIQLRPVLEQIYQEKGGHLPLTGQDIVDYAHTSTSERNNLSNRSVRFGENWKYKALENFERGLYLEKPSIYQTSNPIEAYLDWLKEPDMASKVAESFNNGITDRGGDYPFQHAAWPGQLYYDTPSCHCPKGKIWLDRPPFRGSYHGFLLDGISTRKRKDDRFRLQFPSQRERLLPNHRPAL